MLEAQNLIGPSVLRQMDEKIKSDEYPCSFFRALYAMDGIVCNSVLLAEIIEQVRERRKFSPKCRRRELPFLQSLNLIWQLLTQLDSSEPLKSLSEALSKIDLLEVAAFAGAGAICASLPDILEPADTPNHRAVFQSVCCGGAIAFGALESPRKLWNRTTAMRYKSQRFRIFHIFFLTGHAKGPPHHLMVIA